MEMAQRKSMASIGLIAFAFGLVCLLAQTPGTEKEALTFEVASVKPSDCRQCGSTRTTPGGLGYQAGGATLVTLVSVAYRIDQRQISRGPSWMSTERFNIAARAPRPSTLAELHTMLRTLLEERFNLRVRHELRPESIWELAVAKGGVKMPVHDPEDKDHPPIHGQSKREPGGSACPGLQAQNVNMDSFVRALTRIMGRAVIDKTDLPACYDLDVIFRGESARSGGDAGGKGMTANPDCPDALSALPSQLGLKLVAAKGPVDYLSLSTLKGPQLTEWPPTRQLGHAFSVSPVRAARLANSDRSPRCGSGNRESEPHPPVGFGAGLVQ
jgi:uncharacterized protein (TIGR03435 family)